MKRLPNLDQIRARNATVKTENVRKKEKEGDSLSGYPSLIINNGLLATLAFSKEKGKQHERIANAIAYHLSHMEPLKSWIEPKMESAEALKNSLSESDSMRLRKCTDEALAFLAFLKRFAR